MAVSRQPKIRPKPATSAAGKNAGAPFHYLPVGDSVRAWELYVTGVGLQTYAPGEAYPKAGHPSLYDFNWREGRILPEHTIILITDGAGEFEFRNLPLTKCTAGDALLIAPGQWHRYRPLPATGWTELWMCVGGEYLHRLRSRGVNFMKPHVSLGEHFPETRAALLALLDSARKKSNHNNPLLTAKALEVIARIAEAGGRQTPAADKPEAADPRVRDAIEFIWNNSHRALRIGDVAAAAGLLPRTLERQFAASHSRTVRAEIEWSRCARARRLLHDTKLPIKEIAYACGFGDPRRMIDVFRRREGVSPSHIRARTAKTIFE
ncbi:MAG: helix-turn-helix domain-containing protein [Verrucomicrobia bacterium]|nr:helix-turn-helix domain-containing protein [Verrucomicrobiota bacterium]